MRYPILRYGDAAEMRRYAIDIPLADLARLLRRDERTVRDWMTGRTRVPFWVPELLRLRAVEREQMLRYMFGPEGTSANAKARNARRRKFLKFRHLQIPMNWIKK